MRSSKDLVWETLQIVVMSRLGAPDRQLDGGRSAVLSHKVRASGRQSHTGDAGASNQTQLFTFSIHVVHTCTCAYTCVYIYTYIRLSICIHMYTCTCIYTYMYIYIYHMYIYTYIYIKYTCGIIRVYTHYPKLASITLIFKGVLRG